jgi:hypothetical protein
VAKAIFRTICRRLRTTNCANWRSATTAFADKMRQVINEVRKMSVSIAREAVVVRKSVGETSAKRRAKQGRDYRGRCLPPAMRRRRRSMRCRRSTEMISNSTESNLGNARLSLDEMLEIVGQGTGRQRQAGDAFNGTVNNLEPAFRQHPHDRRPDPRISPTRPICWRSTQPSRRRGPVRPGAVSRWLPTRSASWPRRSTWRPGDQPKHHRHDFTLVRRYAERERS